MVGDFEKNKAWADAHSDEIDRVVRQVAKRLVHIAPTSPARDVAEGADYDIIVPSSALSCRIRRARPDRDLTMTTHRPSGATSEVVKIRSGSVRWYLYAWAEGGRFVDWMFVDLDTVRRRGLIDKAPEKSGPDGSKFLFIPFDDLKAAGAIVDSSRPAMP